MNIRVRTSSRLHFGLLALPVRWGSDAVSPEGASTSARRGWGGAGLMVAQPGLDVEASPAPHWSADGPLAERILDIVHTVEKSLPPHAPASLQPQWEKHRNRQEPPRLHFHLHHHSLEHQGLGTGTQLALAVARALAEFSGLEDRTAPALARRVGRGVRSALGIHGFDHGGFLVDGGKKGEDQIAPLIARVPFPEAWRVLLILFPAALGCHGREEAEAFHLLRRQAAALEADRLCRLVLLGMLPALAETDLPAFGEALYEFNQRVGEAFAPVQGGIYSHPSAPDVVAFLRAEGVAGVGQSSWGPGLFAIVEDVERAEYLAGKLCDQFYFQKHNVIITEAANQGAQVSLSD